MMGDLGIFLGYVLAKTKHAEMAYGDLWGPVDDL